MSEEIPDGFKKTEIGVIPEEWEVVKLGNIFEIKQGKALSPKHRRGISPKPFIRTSNVLWGKIDLSHIDYMDFNEEEVEKYMLKPSDLLVCEGGEIGRTAIWSLDEGVFCYQNHIHRLRPKNSGTYPLFYMYWMQAALLLLRIYKGTGNVTTIPNLSRSRLSNFLLPLPPLPEQQKIAHVLSTIQEAKEKTEAVINASKELKKSLMKYLFTYGPVPLNEAENVKLKETEIGLIPEEWEVVKLGDVVREKITDGVHKTPKYVEKGIPFITAKDIINNKIYFCNCKFISVEEHKNLIKRVKPERGDILLTKVGTVGNVAMVEDNKEFSIFVQVALIKPDYNKVYSLYLKYALLSKNVQTDIINKSAQSTMKFIGTQKIAKISIPLPPLHIQQKIASILSAVDEKIEKEENKKKALEELFKSMLHNLMTGKVRVKDLDIEVEKENNGVKMG